MCTRRVNLALLFLLVGLVVYNLFLILNILRQNASYKPQTLGEETETATTPKPVPTPTPLILSVDFPNTKAIAASKDLYETDVSIKTSSNASVGFWYQGPNNPYGTSVYEDKTVALKIDHTFHISALPVGIYEFFAVAFLNQNQKAPYEKYPKTGTNFMYIGVTAPTSTPKTPTPSNTSTVVQIKNVLVSDIKADDASLNSYQATLSFSTNYDTQATVTLYGPSSPDGTTIATSRTDLTQNHTISLKGLYKGTYTYYILVNTNPTDPNTPFARYPQTATAKFEVK